MATSPTTSKLPSFRQVPDPVKPSEKGDCCPARTQDIALPIIASLVGFVFLPVQLAVAITFVVTVGSILYYNNCLDCLDCSDKGPAGPKKDAQTPTDIFNEVLRFRPMSDNSGNPQGSVESDVEVHASPDSVGGSPRVEIKNDKPIDRIVIDWSGLDDACPDNIPLTEKGEQSLEADPLHSLYDEDEV